MKTKTPAVKPTLEKIKYMKQDKATGQLVEHEVLAEQIVELAEAAQRMKNGRLTKRAIVLLLHDACKGRVGKPAIEDVLDMLPELANLFLKRAAA